jgi:methanol---5-hydroxybenzimidazolylcobamide Co-methyltransferase
VANVKLLGGMAPTVSVEQLAYACRLMNAAAAAGRELELRDLLVASDAALDPQAHVLRPDVVLELAAEIVAEPSPYRRVRRATVATLESLRRAHAAGELTLPAREVSWLERLSSAADELPEDEDPFVRETLARVELSKVRLEEYELEEFR